MTKHCRLVAFFLIVAFILGWGQPARAQTPTPAPAVHAVLFYSPTCGHCAYVINEVLPPLFTQYGNQLQMIGVDVTHPDGQTLFLTALQLLNVERASVPFLVVGDTYLVGSVDIPEQFPGLIDQHLASGGVDWPAIPGLLELIGAVEATQAAASSPTPLTPTPLPTTSMPVESTPAPDPEPTATPDPFLLVGGTGDSLADRLARDPLGNGAAIVVLLGILVCLGWSAWNFYRTPGHSLSGGSAWAILVLCLLGLVVAGYLAYVEATHTEAVCGPVGDCNTVQQSKYARLFGVIPIGVLGLIGYVAMLVAWWIQRMSKGWRSDYAVLALFGMAVFGTVFSAYLTFLEPFVIGATCAWCLASAVIITVLMLIILPSAKLAFEHVREKAAENPTHPPA